MQRAVQVRVVAGCVCDQCTSGGEGSCRVCVCVISVLGGEGSCRVCV